MGRYNINYLLTATTGPRTAGRGDLREQEGREGVHVGDKIRRGSSEATTQEIRRFKTGG
jgi:hypothetical protein